MVWQLGDLCHFGNNYNQVGNDCESYCMAVSDQQTLDISL